MQLPVFLCLFCLLFFIANGYSSVPKTFIFCVFFPQSYENPLIKSMLCVHTLTKFVRPITFKLIEQMRKFAQFFDKIQPFCVSFFAATVNWKLNFHQLFLHSSIGYDNLEQMDFLWCDVIDDIKFHIHVINFWCKS